jgi:AraC-like DNA-binding protein
LRRRVSNYGFLGLAAMHARTLGQAIELMVEFAPVVSTACTLRFEVDAKLASLQLVENVDMGGVRDVVLLSMLLGMQQMSHTLTGREPTGVVEIALPRPAYYERFADVLASVRFDRPQTRIVFDASSLELPLAAADRAALRLARAQCEQLLSRLEQGASFVDCVRRLISQPEGFRTLEQVAALLGLSSRTLKRRLASLDASFSELVEAERHERAKFLLRWSEQPLEQVAQQLGYSTLPNFSRAFKRWSAQTPAAYRRANRVDSMNAPAAQPGLQPMAAEPGAPITSQFG